MKARSQYVYAAGNILNLLIYLQDDLRGIDCSKLTIREVNFSTAELPEANFSHATLTHCLFKNTFTWILCLAVSADGTLLAAGTTTGELRIWHVADAAPILTCVGHRIKSVQSLLVQMGNVWLVEARITPCGSGM